MARRQGVFESVDQVERWQRAKRWIQEKLAPSFLVEFTPPKNFAARVAAARERAGDRQLLLVLDSLQKLPMDLEDRRAGVDAWIRLLERLRHEHEAAVLLISEIKRDQKGQYTAHEAAFKESSGIEYAADLAMTLTRPTADESAEACSTLRVELARDCDDDPRGEVAGYCPLFPFYGLEEVEPERRQAKRRNGATSGERSNHDKPATAPAETGEACTVETLQRKAAEGWFPLLIGPPPRIRPDPFVWGQPGVRSAWLVAPLALYTAVSHMIRPAEGRSS
jgi:hypothetical protein